MDNALLGPPQNSLKLPDLTKIGAPGCTRAFGDMVGSFVSNSDPWGCSAVRDMTMFASHVGSHFPNIGYFQYMGFKV